MTDVAGETAQMMEAMEMGCAKRQSRLLRDFESFIFAGCAGPLYDQSVKNVAPSGQPRPLSCHL